MSSILLRDATPSRLMARYPLELIDALRLGDGRGVVLRPVMPHDADAEGLFVGALSPLSRRLRFHGAVNQLSNAVLDAMTQVDHRRHVALIAQALGPSGQPQIVADARYIVEGLDDGLAPQSAEFAIAVADAWQGVGLGRALLQRLARHARGQGLRRLQGAVLADNAAMLALMRQLGAVVSADPDDTSILRTTITV